MLGGCGKVSSVNRWGCRFYLYISTTSAKTSAMTNADDSPSQRHTHCRRLGPITWRALEAHFWRAALRHPSRKKATPSRIENHAKHRPQIEPGIWDSFLAIECRYLLFPCRSVADRRYHCPYSILVSGSQLRRRLACGPGVPAARRRVQHEKGRA